MDEVLAVKYTSQNRTGEMLKDSVVKFILNGGLAGSGALLLIDVVNNQDKFSRKFGKYTQHQYIGEVYSLVGSLKGLNPAVFNCFINNNRDLKFTKLNTAEYNRNGSGSVFRSAAQNKEIGELMTRVNTKNPIIVSGWDANMCVADSVFGVGNCADMNAKPGHANNLLSMGKTVITSRALLVSEPKDKYLEYCWGIIGGK